MTIQLQNIYLYPIKSAQGYEVGQALVQPQGLSFDRSFMLTDENGKFISARKDAELYAFSAQPTPFGLYVQHQDGTQIVVRYQDFQQQQTNEVWGNHFFSWVAPEAVNQWFSQKIGRTVQLRWLGEQSQRRIKRFPDNPVSFADGYPFLLCNQQSLEKLQQVCPAPVLMQQFRPNLVVSGTPAFTEQQWEKIQIGDIQFFNAKPCVRCVMTSRDIHNHQLHPRLEPFRTLKKLNTNEQGEPVFGINLIPLNSGLINQHSQVEILSLKA